MARPGHLFPWLSKEPGYRERLSAAAPLIPTGWANDGYCAAHSR